MFRQGTDGDRWSTSRSTSIRQKDAGLAFCDGLRVIAKVALEFAGGKEVAELEFDVARTVGEGARVLQALGGLGGIAWNQQPGEEGVEVAQIVVPIIPCRDVPVSLRLAECTVPVAAERLALGLLYAARRCGRFRARVDCKLFS